MSHWSKLPRVWSKKLKENRKLRLYRENVLKMRRLYQKEK